MAYFHSVFSKVFPGPHMPWNNNSSLQLQDMYDQVYSHSIRTSPYQDTILKILGQCFVSEGMTSDMDIPGIPANTSSFKRIAAILGIYYTDIPKILADMRLLVKIDKDQNIKINEPFLRDFLLDQSRSHELFIDLDDARLTLKLAAPIRKVFGSEGM